MADMQVCESCGASIYPEHIDQGRAGRWAGQLLCPVCYAEKRAALAGVGEPAGGSPSAAPATSPAPSGSEPAPSTPADGEAAFADEPISLVDVDETEPAGSKITSFSQRRSAIARGPREFKRPTSVSGQGATRVRTFYAKIQIESIEFLDNSINEWLDEHPDVEVKFVTTTIGVMAGKHPEPNLILNIWY